MNIELIIMIRTHEAEQSKYWMNIELYEIQIAAATTYVSGITKH